MEEKETQQTENIQPDPRDNMIKVRDEKIELLSTHLASLVSWAESYNPGGRCVMCGGRAGNHRTIGAMQNVTSKGVTRQHRVTLDCPIGEAKKSL